MSEANDSGHKQLIFDLQSLMHEALDYEFHDFKNKKYDAPKIELYRKLTTLANRVKEGHYDND